MKRYTRLLQSQSKAIYLIFVVITLGGILAFFNLPSGIYPELSFPRISVIAAAGNSSPEQLVLTVTRPLEQAASQVYGVRQIRSKTIRGSAELSIEFQEHTDILPALQQLQSRISEARNTLPADINLNIERVTPATYFPVLTYNVSSDTINLVDLHTIAEYQIRPELSQVAGVSGVQIQGGDTSEVEVEIDPAKLKTYSLSLTQVADALKRSNNLLVVGRINRLYQQNLVIAANQAIDPTALGNVVVTTLGLGKLIFLKDLGQVSLGHTFQTQIVSVHGKPGLTINIFRQPNSNVVSVETGVLKELKALQSKIPPGIQILPAYNESGLVVDAIANVRDSILIGIVLVIVVLYIFLREWRSTAIAVLTIPLSALAAFIVLALVHESLNLMSLGGLAVAIGLVIDDAIVVIENIDRQLKKQLQPREAAAAAMEELVGPISSSTATTVAVFLPLGLLSGVAGQFFISLTIALVAAVIFSLILAFTLTPLLAAQWLKGDESHKELTMIVRLDAWYARILRRVLRKPFWAGVIAVVLVVSGIGIFKQLGSDFLPSFDEGSYIFDYQAPPGTSISETNVLAQKLEDILAKTPEVVTWTRRTGAQNGIFATEPNRGDILVILKPQNQRKRSIFQIINDQRQQTDRQVPQLQTDFHQLLQDELNDLSGSSTPIQQFIFGSNPTELVKFANQAQKSLENISGLVDLAVKGTKFVPEQDIQVNPIQAGQLGLTPEDVSLQVQNSLLGNVATQLPQGDHLVDVRVHFVNSANYNEEQLAQLPIISTSGQMLPLSALAKITSNTSLDQILRQNQQRYVSLEANLQGQSLGTVSLEVKKKLKTLQLPSGYSLADAGLSVTQQQSFNQLLIVLGLGILLVYLVLVIQFQSLTQPLAIFTALPLALFGVVVALWITKIPLNISSFMGIILLVGLVVKNGIILLEYTNRLQEEGKPLEEALVEAGEVRLRPILMTTLCAILGLLPLALGIGAGSGLQKPLAVAVIGGLSLSAIFTLIFVPVVFRVICRFRTTSKKR